MPGNVGTTIADQCDSNPMSINSDSSFTYPGNFTISCNGIYSPIGCDLSTGVPYTNPQPASLLMAFSGTGGPLAQFGNMSSSSATAQYYELYLDTFGRLSWGVFNYGALDVLQTGTPDRPTVFADGNEHIAIVTLGPKGQKIYADGYLLGTQKSTLGNYSQGYWYFGGANLTASSPSGEAWPYGPPNTYFNGTIYYAAWWNGTQLTDAQAICASSQTSVSPIDFKDMPAPDEMLEVKWHQ
jgi:hypothetical protein